MVLVLGKGCEGWRLEVTFIRGEFLDSFLGCVGLIYRLEIKICICVFRGWFGEVR